ncbi:myb-like protein AA [Neodiprion pinetum]|uniref:myb-like protein AA n=1 Tax=Neodiprion pinetum TaxID=441929 RepID=UPI003717F1F7
MGKEDPPIDKKRPAVVHTPPSDRRLRSQVSTQGTQLFEGQLENLEETNASGNSSLTPEQSQISNENSNPTNKNSPENSRKTEKPTQILIQTPDSENQSQTHIKIPQEFKMVSEPVASTGATALPAPTYHYISIKDALEAVPVFDGNPSQVRSFVQGCKDAREMVPPQVELSLARIIRDKIKGVARRVIENERFDTVDELTARINELYGPAKSVNLCQGELGKIFQRQNEDVVTYASRVREAMENIRQAFLQEQRKDDFEIFTRNTEADGRAAFLRGLRPEIDGKIPTVPGTLKELADAAMKVEKQEKIKIQLRLGDQPSTIQDATINYAMFQPYNCVVCGVNDHDKYDCQYNLDKSYYDHRKPRNQTYVTQGNRADYRDNYNSRDAYSDARRNSNTYQLQNTTNSRNQFPKHQNRQINDQPQPGYDSRENRPNRQQGPPNFSNQDNYSNRRSNSPNQQGYLRNNQYRENRYQGNNQYRGNVDPNNNLYRERTYSRDPSPQRSQSNFRQGNQRPNQYDDNQIIRQTRYTPQTNYQPYNSNRPDEYQTEQPHEHCRYCRNYGHLISECPIKERSGRLNQIPLENRVSFLGNGKSLPNDGATSEALKIPNRTLSIIQGVPIEN